MKKQLFFAAIAAAVAMTSCSNDETLSVNIGEGITFRTPAVTRATEATTPSLMKFNVTALNASNQNYFTDVMFSKQENGSYTSTTEYYWPGDNSTLSFYAYAPTSLNPTIDGTTKQLEFTPDADISNQVDFIVATASGNKMSNESSGVPLTFSHKLSQIEVKALNENTDAYVFKVAGVKIGCVANSGTYTFNMTSGSDSWTESTDKDSYTVEYDANAIRLDGNAQTLMGEGGNAMLVPQTLDPWNVESDKDNSSKGSYLSVKLNIETVDGAQVYPFDNEEEYAWAAIPVDTEWEMGHKYIYTIQFGHGGGYVDPDEGDDQGEQIFGEPIFFTVEDVAKWDDNTEEVDLDLKD